MNVEQYLSRSNPTGRLSMMVADDHRSLVDKKEWIRLNSMSGVCCAGQSSIGEGLGRRNKVLQEVIRDKVEGLRFRSKKKD